MKFAILIQRGACLLIAIALASVCVTTNAADTTPGAPSNPDQWRYAVTLYGYFPSIYGESTFPNGAAGPAFS